MKQLEGQKKVQNDNLVLDRCKKIGGWMYDEELIWLNQSVKDCSVAVEIGVWQGKSTTAIALGLPDGAKLFAIDTWKGSDDELNSSHSIMQTTEGQMSIYIDAMKNLFEFISFGKVIPICMSSIYAYEFIGPLIHEIDFIFIDGSHDYISVKQDIESWSQMTHKNSIIAGHDYTWPGVNKAVTELFGSNVNRGPGSIWFVECAKLK